MRAYGSSEGVALGMRRLSIIDLSTGHQPIHNEDRTVWIVFNGEIYNFRELRRELEAAGPSLLHLDRHRGRSSTPTSSGARTRSRGCAACSASRSGITRSRTLLVARDRIGIKPMHYADGERPALLRIGDQVAARGARPAARSRRRRARSLPVVPLHAARRLDLRRASASCRPVTC